MLRLNYRCGFGSLVLLSALITASPDALASTQSSHVRSADIRGSTMLLCAVPGTSATAMSGARLVVSRRVRNGFHFKGAAVTLTSSTCIQVKLPHMIGWLRWLAEDVSSTGRFGIGLTVPNPKQHLATGSTVRFKNEPLTTANSRLPVVKVVIGHRGFRGFTAKYERRAQYDYVGVDLTPSGSRTLCSFTKRNFGGLAAVVLDHRVVTDEKITVQICGGSILTGFPIEHSLDHPLGPRQIVADLHSGPLRVPLTVASVR